MWPCPLDQPMSEQAAVSPNMKPKQVSEPTSPTRGQIQEARATMAHQPEKKRIQKKLEKMIGKKEFADKGTR